MPIKAVSWVAGITGARPVKMGEIQFVTDSAPGLAGHALGPTAPEMLLGALASCLVHTYLIQATCSSCRWTTWKWKFRARWIWRASLGCRTRLCPNWKA